MIPNSPIQSWFGAASTALRLPKTLKGPIRLAVCVVVGMVGTTIAGPAPAHPPVIDVHVHTTNTTPGQVRDKMTQLNIRYVVVSSLAGDLSRWASTLAPNQFAPGLILPGHSCLCSPSRPRRCVWIIFWAWNVQQSDGSRSCATYRRVNLCSLERFEDASEARQRIAAFSEYWPGDYVIVPPKYEQQMRQ